MTTIPSTESNPDAIHVTTVDDANVSIDCTALLASGETVTSAVCTLTSLTDGSTVTLSAATTSSPSVSQPLQGSLLTAGMEYRLVWAITLSSGSVLGQATKLVVDY